MTEPMTAEQESDAFFDSAYWPHLPHDSDVALYCDGNFEAPPTAEKELNAKRVRLITVTGNWRNASIVDYEKLNPVYFPAGLRAFVRGRRSLNMDAIVYCNQSTAAEAISALRDSGHGTLLDYPRLFWWIATLDNVELSAVELARQLMDLWDAPEITIRNLWANQWTQGDGGLYDESRRYLSWRP